jgi:hypothetical protein
LPKFFKANINTPARLNLARLHEARAEAASEANEARARIARLAEIAKAADPIRAKLGALDAQEAANFAAWSSDPGAPVPAADTAARVALQRELADAQAQADAASRAIAGMGHETTTANAKVAAAEAQVPLAAAVVVLEALGPIADEARAAVAKIADLRMKGHTLLNELLSVSSGADVAPAGRTDFMREYGAASTALTGAFDLPHLDPAAADAFRAKVLTMLVALRSDAGATLES